MLPKATKCSNPKKKESKFGNLLVPKIFRWIFFRKNVVESAFNAVRNENAIFVDTSLHLNPNHESFPNSIALDKSKLNNFIQVTPKDAVIVLFGNSAQKTTHLHNALEERGFNKVFYVGTLQELKQMKDS